MVPDFKELTWEGQRHDVSAVLQEVLWRQEPSVEGANMHSLP